jgi:hypothetical protein
MRAVALAALLAAACGQGEHPRCAECGMPADRDAKWQAGVTTSDGKDLLFDTPRCLLRWLRTPAGRGAEGPWVTEYYSQRKAPAAFVFYVTGSDVSGPMGAELVPVSTQPSAERFMAQHHGTALHDFDHIDDTDLARP